MPTENDNVAAPDVDEQIVVDIGAADEPVLEVETPAADSPIDDTPADGAETLAAQLQAAKAAGQAADERAYALQQERDDALRIAQDRDARWRQASAQTADAEYSGLQNALAAAHADQSAAQQALDTASEVGDSKAIGAATAKISRAASQIERMEMAVAQLTDQQRREAEWAEYEARRPRPQPRPQQPQHFTPEQIKASIDNDQTLLAPEKVWLNKHPNDRIDPARQQLLRAACQRAAEDGHARGTPGYLNRVDDIMGYKSQQRSAGQSGSVSAPVSRGAATMTGRPVQPDRVTLTKGDQELAASIGVDLSDPKQRKEYAQSKVKVAAAEKANPQSYN